jgi:hypothetical protein
MEQTIAALTNAEALWIRKPLAESISCSAQDR